MKKLLSILLLPFLAFFTFCSNDDEVSISSSPEKFSLHMAVTNDDGEDLVFTSEDYLTTGDYANRFKFETWNAYLGDKSVQASKEDPMSRFKSTAYNPKMDKYFIFLDTEGRLQQQMKDWNKRHQAKYVMTSPALFGDTKEHTIDLSILGITDKVKQHFYVEFSVSVDGVEQTVYYPEWWEGMYPKDPHAIVHTPYFILNVDDL